MRRVLPLDAKDFLCNTFTHVGEPQRQWVMFHTTRAKSLSSWHRLAHVYLKIPRFPTCVSIWGILYTMKYGAQEFLAPAFSEKIEPKKSSLKLSNSNNYLCPRGLVDCDEMGAQPTVHVVAWDLKKHNPLKYPQISLQVEVP